MTNVGGCQIYYLGTGTSFDVSSIPGYQNLTADNFVVMPNTGRNETSYNCNDTDRGISTSLTRSIAYNKSSGTFTCSYTASGGAHSANGGNGGVSVSVACKVYLIIGKIKTI